MPKNSSGKEAAEIFADKCIGCQLCAGECPVGAIEMVDGVARVDPEICISCGKCFDVCPVEAVKFEKTLHRGARKSKAEAARMAPSTHQGVAVYVEVSDGKAATVSWELAGKARMLADTLKTTVIGLLAGYNVEGIASEAIAYGCDEVHLIDHPALAVYRSKPYGMALVTLCQAVRPAIVLMGATTLGRDLASVVATTLETGLTADCTGLNIEEETGLLLMTRPTFGGNIMATIFCQHHRPQMSTVRPRVFPLGTRDLQRTGTVRPHDYYPPDEPLPERIRLIQAADEQGALDITRYPALIVAGKGACDPGSLGLLQELADLVGGTVACSRPVVEAGLMPYERQVGQTGKTVAPKLYIAVGVSGAVQHLVGMQGSEKIIAINADPHAPVFRVADVGLVGDYKTIIPLLIDELKGRIGNQIASGQER